MTETIRQAHARIANALGMELQGITAAYQPRASVGGVARMVLDIARVDQDSDHDHDDAQWTIRAEVNIPAGNHGPAGLAQRLGELTQLAHLQATALAMVGGRTWEAIE